MFPFKWAKLDDQKRSELAEELNDLVYEKLGILFKDCEVDWCSQHMLQERWNNRFGYRDDSK